VDRIRISGPGDERVLRANFLRPSLEILFSGNLLENRSGDLRVGGWGRSDDRLGGDGGGLRDERILQAQEFFFEESSRQIGDGDGCAAGDRESEKNEFEMIVGRKQLRAKVAADAVIHAEREQVIEIEAVADVSEKAEDGGVDVAPG
jgi:hypothetical protein